jgi:phytoene synthase
MTDTANPQKLASTETFDSRLKSLDEARWLASRYAPDDARRRLVAVWLLRAELHRALSATEPMLGKIRLQWWRESIDSAATSAPRRHDLTEEIAAILAVFPALLEPMQAVVDRHDDILDDHLAAGGHVAGAEHEQRHIDAEAACWRLAGLALSPDATNSHLQTLSALAAAEVAARGELPDATARWQAARTSARTLPSALWPAAAQIAASAKRKTPHGPTGLRLAILWAVLSRRI